MNKQKVYYVRSEISRNIDIILFDSKLCCYTFPIGWNNVEKD